MEIELTHSPGKQTINHDRYEESSTSTSSDDVSLIDDLTNNWRETQFVNFQSIRWKILLIALITSSIFSIYLVVDLIQANKQASLLQEIHDKRYPAQIKLQEAFFALRLVQSRLQDAVITNDIDSLEETTALKVQFAGLMDDIKLIDNNQAQTSSHISRIFEIYYNKSYRLAEDIINDKATITDNAKRGRDNQALYAQVVSELDAFKIKELNSFSESVRQASQRARNIIDIGLPASILTFALVFFLAWFTSQRIIQRINQMVVTLRDIARDRGDITVRIPVEGKDEMAELAFWFNRFIQKLQAVTAESTAEIERMAYTDALTQLPNRRQFNSRLKAEIQNAEKRDSKFAVIFLDLDNFKMVNDQFGHDAGDALVCEIGLRLQDTLRENDVVAHDEDITHPPKGFMSNLVARMGGDEFMLIISNATNLKQVEIIAERIRGAVLMPIVINDTELKIGVSMGIAIYPKDGSDAEALVVNADLAMYEAKSRGKNNYCLFNNDIESEAKLNLKVETSLREGLMQGEFELYYQPKINLNNMEIVGAEALIRWNSPAMGRIPPDQFIPIAEHSDLIYEIDEWVLLQATGQMHSWKNSGFDLIPIAINISAKQAARSNLVDKIGKAIRTFQIPPNMFEIEITETSALSNMDAVAANIRALKKLNVPVALDDFGAGHSSLSLLKYCDIETLKIDRVFLPELIPDKNQKPIYKAVINLAKSLNMKIVAEGIEEEIQLEALRSMNCDIAQGYLFATPMKVEEFEDYLLTHTKSKALNRV